MSNTSTSLSNAEAQDAGSQGLMKVILASSVGTLIEWYDFYTYAFTALYFAPSFFPKGNQTTQLLQTAAGLPSTDRHGQAAQRRKPINR